MKVLIVEDEPDICEIIKISLESINYEVISKSCAEEAISFLEKQSTDLIIMDLNLPDINGYDLCKIIKSKPALAGIPIIIISGKFVHPEDKILALNIGADDYITKPFNTGELIARVNAVMRRSVVYKIEEKILVDEQLRINLETHIVTVDEKNINLTPKEFDLLCYLVKNKGKVFNRENLLNYVWGNKLFWYNTNCRRARWPVERKIASEVC